MWRVYADVVHTRAGLVSAAASWSRSDVLSLAGVCVSVLGFGIAIWQLVRTANATEVTRDAMLTSTRTQLLFLLPQIRQLHQELDLCIDTDQRSMAARSLGSYSALVHEVAALMTELKIGDSTDIAELQGAARAASLAKNEIFSNKAKKLSLITASVQQKMTLVSERMAIVRTLSVSLNASKTRGRKRHATVG